VGDQDESWACHISCVTCQASHRMGKCFAPYAVRRSHGLEKPKDAHLIVTLFEKQNRDHLQTQTYIEKCRFSICNKAYPAQWGLPAPKSLDNLLAITNLILMKITESKKEKRWLRSDILSKLFIWTSFITSRRSQRPCPWYEIA